MNWKEIYKRKLVSAEEAVKVIKSGHNISLPLGMAEPYSLVEAMADHVERENLRNIVVYQMLALRSDLKYLRPEMQDRIAYHSFFLGPGSRPHFRDGRIYHTLQFFHMSPRFFLEEHVDLHVAMTTVSPPDKHGFCSLSVGVDWTKAACEMADYVIVEVNPTAPRVFGDALIHVRDIDHFVEVNTPIPAPPRQEPGEREMKIGQLVAELIKDGDTIQIGFGSIPDSITRFLKDKKDLGVHTEMIFDGIVDLDAWGVLTGKRKTLHRGKVVGCFAMGCRALYDWMDDNPSLEMYPVSYTNDPAVIAKNDNMVSVNAALQVDLRGQINAECIGLQQYSGVGGQVDWVRGASASKGGMSIITLLSTALDGTVSTIVPCLPEGSLVTTTANDVDYICTEYGIARMRFKDLKRRAQELINIAHPRFRDELTFTAKKMGRL